MVENRVYKKVLTIRQNQRTGNECCLTGRFLQDACRLPYHLQYWRPCLCAKHADSSDTNVVSDLVNNLILRMAVSTTTEERDCDRPGQGGVGSWFVFSSGTLV